MLALYPPSLMSLHSPRLSKVLFFTLHQAGLSALLSVALGGLLALACYRQARLWQRASWLALISLPFVIPSIAAIFGIVGIFGREGVFNQLLSLLGIAPWRGLYGVNGILIAHCFFNIPLVLRLVLPVLERIPQEMHQLSQQLDLPWQSRWSIIYWPLLRPILSNTLILVFLLCFASFAIVLTLGGGPKSTTLPTLLFEALRVDMDFATASSIALLHMACVGVALMGLSAKTSIFVDDHPQVGHVAPSSIIQKCSDYFFILIISLFLCAPIIYLVLDGLRHLSWSILSSALLRQALLNSLGIALISSLIGGCIALFFMVLKVSSKLADIALLIPAPLLGAGWFVALQGDAKGWGWLIVAWMNAAVTLPFWLRLVAAQQRKIELDYQLLMQQLSLSTFQQWRSIYLPLLKPALISAWVLSFVSSLGDLGVIALFGDEGFLTLPLLIYRQIGSYRAPDAAVSSLILLGVILGIYSLFNLYNTAANDR